MKDIKIFLKKKKTKIKKNPEKDIKILLKKKKEKSVNIIANEIKIFLKNQAKANRVYKKLLFST